MKIDFLPDVSIIRLFDFLPIEVEQFKQVVQALADDKIDRVAIHQLPYVVPVGNCELTFCARKWDQAVIRVGESSFECGLTRSEWDNMTGFIETILTETHGHQWLTDVPGEAYIVMSKDGDW
jgi:hypothetical protein